MWLYTHFLAHCWMNSDAEAEWNPKKSTITFLYNSDQMSQFHCCLGYWEYFQARCCLLSTHVSSSVLCFSQTQRSLRAAGKQSSRQGTACCYPACLLPAVLRQPPSGQTIQTPRGLRESARPLNLGPETGMQRAAPAPLTCHSYTTVADVAQSCSEEGSLEDSHSW